MRACPAAKKPSFSGGLAVAVLLLHCCCCTAVVALLLHQSEGQSADTPRVGLPPCIQGAPRLVYRAPGGALPANFWQRSGNGTIGILEAGCLSTSTEKEEAMHYARRGDAKLIFEVAQGFVGRGASISWLSQHPAEAEILFPPGASTGVQAQGHALAEALSPSLRATRVHVPSRRSITFHHVPSRSITFLQHHHATTLTSSCIDWPAPISTAPTSPTPTLTRSDGARGAWLARRGRYGDR